MGWMWHVAVDSCYCLLCQINPHELQELDDFTPLEVRLKKRRKITKEEEEEVWLCHNLLTYIEL